MVDTFSTWIIRDGVLFVKFAGRKGVGREWREVIRFLGVGSGLDFQSF
jgi:hypothetical protein